MFVHVGQGFDRNGYVLVPSTENLEKYIKDSSKDWYRSIFEYSEQQKSKIEKDGVSGLTATSTNRLVFDLDSKDDLNKAKEQTTNLCLDLMDMGINQDSLSVCFSGMKGFTLEVLLSNRITPEQLKAIAVKLHKKYDTIDVKVTDANRIIRLPNTKHAGSGLYKIPLYPHELTELSIEQIKEMAKTTRKITQTVSPSALPKELNLTSAVKLEKVVKTPVNIDFQNDRKLLLFNKPKEWRNCKYLLLQGHFQASERHNALMVLAATARGLGYDRETAYAFCKTAIKKQARLFNVEEFSTDELWNNILESVYRQNWQGGAYTCKSDAWLQHYCNSLGEHTCKDRNDIDIHACVPVDKMEQEFVNYAKDFDANIITTGLKTLDEEVTLSTHTLVGLLGQPGAGKTSWALNLLNHNSLKGIPAIFFSLDMAMPIVFAKLLQRRRPMDFKSAINYPKNKPNDYNLAIKEVKNDFKNVTFNFKSGMKVEDLRNYIIQTNEMQGKPTKLVVIDYLECIAGEYADATANSGMIANKLKDIASELGVCIVLLLQTQKHSVSNISDPLTSMKQIKGSSVLEQSCTSILTLWREGYSVETIDDDKFISFSLVKSRFNPMWTGHFRWNGLNGSVRELTGEEEEQRKELVKRKAEAKALKSTDGWS